jgi:hypothetical protein
VWHGLSPPVAVHIHRDVEEHAICSSTEPAGETEQAEQASETTQGWAADAQFVKWLMEHQKEAGVFRTVCG